MKNLYKRYVVGILLSIAIHPLWGIIVQSVIPGIKDGFLIRLYFMVPSIVLLILSFLFKKYKMHIFNFYLTISMLTVSYYYLIHINNYNFLHIPGVYVILAASLAAIDNRKFLNIFCFIIMTSSLFLAVKNFDNILIFVHYLNLITMLGIASYFAILRLNDKDALSREFESNLIYTSQIKKINSLAVQVAHDIRAPVTALDFVSKTLEVSDPKKQQIIKEASNRINDIADQLLREFKANPSLPSDLLSNVEPALNHNSNGIPVKQYNIGKAISSVVAEKKTIVRNDIEIITSLAQVHYDIRTSLDPVEFKRILSNILNNSIEAFDDGQGKISITATDSPRFVNINIQDNGKGVPSQLLHKLMERGFSFGKERGTGVGLSHAKEALESVGGTLEVLSKQGKGTLVILSMPKI